MPCFKLLFIFIIVFSCQKKWNTTPSELRELTKKEVLSFQEKSMGENFSLESIIVDLFGKGVLLKKINISIEYYSIENRSAATAEIYREGLADDSIKGDWHRLRFTKEVDGWSLRSGDIALKCYRENQDRYQLGPCL